MSSFICTECGRCKDTHEAVFMDLCADCEMDHELTKKRAKLYELFNLPIPVTP